MVFLVLVCEFCYVENICEWVVDIEVKCIVKVKECFNDLFMFEFCLIGVDVILGSLDKIVMIGFEVGVLGIVMVLIEVIFCEVVKILNFYLLYYLLSEQEEMFIFVFLFLLVEMFCGEIYEFCFNYVLELIDFMEVFCFEVLEVGK